MIAKEEKQEDGIMRKRTVILLTSILLAYCTTVFAADLQYTALYVGSNKAFVNDVEKQIDEQNKNVAVFVENERSYVPVRFISENYGGSVEWIPETQTVNIVFLDRAISLTIGINEIIIDGKKQELDVAPVIRDERTFLPLRACTEAIGKEVFYSDGLILISDIKDILDPRWDKDIVKLLISHFE